MSIYRQTLQAMRDAGIEVGQKTTGKVFTMRDANIRVSARNIRYGSIGKPPSITCTYIFL